MSKWWRRGLLALFGVAGAALAAAVLIPAACGGCTTIGCADGLYIVLRRAPARPFTIAVTFPTARGDSVVSRSCAPDDVCEVAIMGCPGERCVVLAEFEHHTPSRAVVRLTTSNGWSEWRVRPRYAARYPNGRACGAACRAAMVSLAEP